MTRLFHGQNYIASKNLTMCACCVLGIESTLLTVITQKNSVDFNIFAYKNLII